MRGTLGAVAVGISAHKSGFASRFTAILNEQAGSSLLVIIVVGVIWLVSSFAQLALELCSRA
jgi:hypothetical protein